jgi:hypothetical protein
VLIPDQDFIHKTIEIIGIEYSVKRKPRRTIMTIIKKWLEAIKNFLAPKKQTTKRKTNVKRTTRKKSK